MLKNKHTRKTSLNTHYLRGSLTNNTTKLESDLGVSREANSSSTCPMESSGWCHLSVCLSAQLGTGLEKLSVHRLGAREHIFLEVFNSEMMLSGY